MTTATTTALPELPHNFEAEQALLGALLHNNTAVVDVREVVEARHFADPLHGQLFDAVLRLVDRGQQASAFTLKTYAETSEGLKAVGGPAYLARLLAASVHAADAVRMARTVRDCYQRRRLVEACVDTLPRANDTGGDFDATSIIEGLERQLFEIADSSLAEGVRPFSKLLAKTFDTIEQAYRSPEQVAGLSTGFAGIDDMLGGLNRSDLLILAARPSMGKTALGLNIAANVAERGKVALVFSLEMSAEQLCMRIIAERTGINSARLRNTRGDHVLTSIEFDRALSVANALEAWPLFTDDTPALTMSAIRTKARRCKRQHGLDLIVVDYLQLVNPSNRRASDNRQVEVSEISRALKTLAKELDVPVVALSQLSREVEKRPDKRPQLADLRDSGSIEQDADVVAFIFREEYYLERGDDDDRARLPEVQGKAEVIIGKNRHGPTGVIPLRFDGRLTKFSDLEAAQ